MDLYHYFASNIKYAYENYSEESCDIPFIVNYTTNEQTSVHRVETIYMFFQIKWENNIPNMLNWIKHYDPAFHRTILLKLLNEKIINIDLCITYIQYIMPLIEKMPIRANYSSWYYKECILIPITESCILKNYDICIILLQYPKMLNCKQVYIDSVFKGYCDIYDILKNNIDYTHITKITIGDFNILNDIYCYHYQVWNKIDVGQTLIALKYDPNVINILWLMNILEKYDTFEKYLDFIIKNDCFNDNYFTEVMDNHIINLIMKNDYQVHTFFNKKNICNCKSFEYFKKFYDMS